MAVLLGLGLAPAAMAMPVQFFYVPFPEDQLLAMLTSVESGGYGETPASPLTSYITITSVADNTIIFYDQWENGYDIDIANTYNIYTATNLGGTQIWGDGDTANGAPPGVPTDLITYGTVIQLENDVPTDTRESVIDFDGGDKVAATKTIAITRSTWATDTGTLFAGCVEVFDTNNWGTDYRAPLGTNVANSYQMFEYTALSIMAGQDGATISVDTNSDGDYSDAGDLSGVVLEEGHSTYVTGVYAGAHVVSDNPVQVDILTGDIASNYESRDSALVPTSLWSSSYYAPVSTPNVSTNAGDERTTVWLYNPGATALTVTYERRNTSGVLTTSTVWVPGGGVAKQILDNATNGTGSHFYSSGAVFYGFSTTDSASADTANNQAWDWGYSLIPEDLLTTEALVGLGIGRDPESDVNLDENGNPVWVTTVGNGDTAATVYVDYDADPTTGSMQDASGYWCDASYSLRELDQARIYAPTGTTSSIAVDATSSGSTGDGATATTMNITHVTSTASDRLMLVSVAIANDSTTMRNVSSVTYGGTALTYWGRVLAPDGGGGDGSTPYARPQVEIWALANPPSGSGTVTVTLSGAKAFVAGVTTFSGVDVSGGLTSALGTFASASANYGNTQSVSVTTTAGQMVYDCVAAGVSAKRNTADPSNFTVGADQSQLWTQFARSEDGTRDRHVRAAGSYETATGTSTAMSWTTTTSYPWAIGAVPINALVVTSPAATNQTGFLVYTLDAGVKLAVAWGQDPQTSTAGAPGLDVGTSVPPMPEFTAGKDGLLYDDDNDPSNGYSGDHDSDGYITCGDEIVWPIAVYNVSRIPVPDVVVSDVIPADTTYVPNSTYLDGTTPIADGGSTAFPLDEGGYTYGTVFVGGSFTVTFRVIIDDYVDLTPGTLAIYNDGLAHAFSRDDPVDDRVYLRGRISNSVWYDADADGIQDTGEEGIAGVTITLQDGAGNVIYYDDGQPITTVTDSSGLYDFKGLLPGSYVVKFVAPEGASLTLQTQGGDTTLDSDADPTTGLTAPITIGGGEHNPTIDAGFYRTNPTAVVVSSFAAYDMSGRVAVHWQTGSETRTAGFFVERLDATSGQWAVVNQELVPALFEARSGGSYSVIDYGAQPGMTLTYRLVEVQMSGVRRTYGPYEVFSGSPFPTDGLAEAIARGEQSHRVERAPAWDRTPAWADPASRPGKRAENANRLRIETSEPGLYRVDASDLAAGLGISEGRARGLIGSKGVNLTTGGHTVAYARAGDNSALYFYGEAIDSIYTNKNVYWLAIGKGTTMADSPDAVPSNPVFPIWTPPATTPGRGGRGVPPSTSSTTTSTTASALVQTSFVDQLHIEQDVFPLTDLFHEAESDFWLWKYVVAGYAPLQSAAFTFDTPDVLGGIQLEVALRGMVTADRANEHHAQIALNGVALGETRWTGTAAHSVGFTIPVGLLTTGANEIVVTAALDSGIPYSIFAVDSFDVDYERAASAVGDSLLIESSPGGLFRVGGLSSADVWVLDLNDPQIPRLVRVKESGGGAGTAWVTFNSSQGTEYLVAAAAAAAHPAAIDATKSATLRIPGRGADYVVITAPALVESALHQAAYRTGRGLRTAVVTTTEIYDDFNFGIADPHAIQDFIAYALTSWHPAPRYVLLAGEGSYDYKDSSGYGDSLVPPLMVDTEYGLAPSDVLLGDVTGADGVPEVAIGRIPALSPEDLDAALAEIQAYEAAGGSVGSTVLLAADDPDEGGGFHADSDSLAAVLPSSLSVNRAYLGQISAGEAHAAMLNAFASGALLVNYIGHGGEDLLAAESLLASSDVPSMAVGSRLPLVVALTCKAGQYGLPGYDCISENLVKRSGAGAIGVWSSSAMEDNASSVRLGTLFAQRLFGTSQSVVLGDAIRSAMAAAAQEALPASSLRTYNLLGDPALRVTW